MAINMYCLLAWLVLWRVWVPGDASGDATTPPHHQCTIKTQTTAICSHLQLTSVPQSLPNTLKVLDLSFNNITVLHNASFTNYNLIQVLNVSENFIHVLESGTFGNLPELQELILANNSLTEMPSTLFRNSTFISTLILSGNKLRKTPHLPRLFCSNKLQGTTTVSEWRKVRLIDFSRNNLTSVEKEDFAHFRNCSIDKFLLGYNPLTSFPENVFSEFSKVGKLDMDHVNLGKFEVRSFLGNEEITDLSLKGSKIHSIVPLNESTYISREQFPQIKILTFKRNEIEHIPDYALRGFKNLKLLDLRENRIYAISNKSFCELEHLMLLILSNNTIESLSHSTFACLANLEYINLALNTLYILDPRWFAGSSSLRNLDLFRCNINFIKDGPWNTTDLQIINLSYNKLNYIGRLMFTGLSRLRILILKGNIHLYTMDSNTFTYMTALEVLDISNIGRLILKNSLAELQNLVFLDCSFIETGLQFVSIHQFTHTSALRTLNMSYSNIHTHDLVNDITNKSLFMGLISLHTLRMRGNKLYHLPNVPWIFSPLINMKLLDLGACYLTVLPSEVFNNLTALKELRLNSNEIAKISEHAFQHLYNLHHLFLQYNKIASIERNLFKGTTKMTQLYLQTNHISTIAPGTIIPPNLKRLNIADNPFTCTCQLTWFAHWLRTTNINLEPRNKTLCSSTSLKALVNQPVLSFHPEQYCGINIFLVTGLTIAFVTLLFLCILVYYKRWWFNYKIFLLKLAVVGYDEITEDVDPGEYGYQLNLMFHDDDQEWVNDYMKPALEERMPHLGRVAFGDDDLNIGMYYVNALYHIIENSFKTALLISNQSVDDAWFMTKLRMAVEHVNDTKLDKIILVFLEDIQEANLPYLVRLLLSRNKPYLLVTEDEDGQDLFWAQFEKAMRANKAINSVIPT